MHVCFRRGQFLGMLTNTGNNSELGQVPALPVWQQVATNEKSMLSLLIYRLWIPHPISTREKVTKNWTKTIALYGLFD